MLYLENKLKIYNVIAIIPLWIGCPLFADVKDELAEKIEITAKYPKQGYLLVEGIKNIREPYKSRHHLLVKECDLSIESFRLGKNGQEEKDYEVTFNLAHTQIPSSSTPQGKTFSYFNFEDNDKIPSGFAIIRFQFSTALQPTVRFNGFDLKTKTWNEIEESAPFIAYTFKELPNEIAARNILTMLNHYQSEYCRSAS
jgi:hypothetical protein